METTEDLDVVMKVEVDENVFDLLEDTKRQETEETASKIEEYKKSLEKKSDEKVQNVREELIIAYNILQASKKNMRNYAPIEELHMYTKIPIPELKEIIKDVTVNKSIKEVLAYTRKIPSSVLFVYDDIRDFFIVYYVTMKQMPSVTNLMEHLRQKSDEAKSIFYKKMDIITLVKNKLVKYNFLPKLNSYILTENPEFSYRRHLYLRRVRQHRLSKNFVYVAIIKIPKTSGMNCLLLAVTSKNGLISRSDYIHFKKNDDESGINEVKLWIRNELVRNISTDSVVLLMHSKLEDNTPTPDSTKADMMKWLSDRFVPHDASSHKSQLYNLIKLTKKNVKEPEFYEEVFASSGIKVLTCPVEYQNLNYFGKILNHALESHQVVGHLVMRIALTEWKFMERQLIEEEKKMLDKDQKMDKVIENLFQMAKNGDLKEEDFPVGCRATKADNFKMHIGDIIRE